MKPSLPESITKNRYWSALAFILPPKAAAQYRRYSKGFQDAGRGVCSADPLGLFVGRNQGTGDLIHAGAVEKACSFSQRGHMAGVDTQFVESARSPRVPDARNPVRLRVRHRFEQDTVEQAEDRRVASYADSKHQYGGPCESFVAT